MVPNTSNAVGDDCSESICESDADESEMDGMLYPHCRPDCSLSYAALSPGNAALSTYPCSTLVSSTDLSHGSSHFKYNLHNIPNTAACKRAL